MGWSGVRSDTGPPFEHRAQLVARQDVVAAQLVARAERTATESVAWQGLTHTLKESLDEAERVEILEMLWEVAYADGVLHDYEASLLRRVAGLLYVSDRDNGEARLRVMAKLGIAR